jgi:hypothetical protein
MKEKDKFIKALGTLFHSWGSDTPPEVFWGANELLNWFEKEYGVTLGVEFEEDNYDEVIKAIKNS